MEKDSYIFIKKRCEQVFRGKYNIQDEDIIYDAMASIILQLHKNSERIENLDSWVFSAIHNHYCNFVRKKAMNKEFTFNAVIHENLHEVQFPETKLELHFVMKEIEKLKSPFKDIINLRLKDLKHEEIAKHLDMKLFTVRKYYRRAISILAKQLNSLSLFLLFSYYLIEVVV